MPNLSKNAEIAQYFAYAYRAPENEPFAQPLTDLIDEMEYFVGQEDYKAYNLELGILNDLKLFQQYSQAAGRDIQAGNTESPNLRSASDTMKKILKGFKRMEEQYPDKYDSYKDYFEPLRDESKVMTATQWIEQARADYKKGLLSPQDAIRQIFAARQLANAERGQRGNIDRTILTKEQIEKRANIINGDLRFDEFLNDNANKLTSLLNGIGSRNHGGKMEDLLTDYALKHKDSRQWDQRIFGRYMPTEEKQAEHFKQVADKARAKQPSASEWIKRAQKELKGGTDDDLLNEPAAEILAARQLAKAQGKDSKKLKASHLHDLEVYSRRNRLMNSKPFQDYIYKLRDDSLQKARDERAQELAEINNLPPTHPNIQEVVKQIRNHAVDRTLFTDGTGEEFEKDFEAYLKTREDYEDLDPELYGKYLPQKKKEETWEIVDGWDFDAPNPDPAGYKGYGDYFQRNKKNEDGTLSPFYHAAKMAAADDLRRNKPDNRFDRKVLENKAAAYMKNPAFRLAMKDEALMKKVAQGDTQSLAKSVQKMQEDFENGLMIGSSFRESRERLNDMELSPAGQKMVVYAEEIDANRPEECIALVDSILDFQNENMSEKTGPNAEAVNESLKLLGECVDGTDAEHYLHEQLQKVNEARGLQPGQPGYLGKADVVKPVDVVPEEDYEPTAAQKDLFDKIRNFKFGSGSEEPEDDLNKSEDNIPVI